MNEKSYTKPFDEVYFVFSVLKRLGCGTMGSFRNRLKSQKVQYIAQLFDIVPSYSYNLYIHGPYSPDLSNDLFLIAEQGAKPNTEKFLPEELEDKFKVVKEFIKDLDVRELELVATLHWFLKRAELSRPRAIAKIKEVKDASERELNTTIKLYNTLCQALKN